MFCARICDNIINVIESPNNFIEYEIAIQIVHIIYFIMVLNAINHLNLEYYNNEECIKNCKYLVETNEIIKLCWDNLFKINIYNIKQFIEKQIRDKSEYSTDVFNFKQLIFNLAYKLLRTEDFIKKDKEMLLFLQDNLLKMLS